MGSPHCSKCGELKTQKNGKHFKCAPCARNRTREWQKNNSQRRKEYKQNYKKDTSGNFKVYIGTLLSKQRREDGLTADFLLKLLEKQDYKCALTGVQMTSIRGEGKVATNVSIDRIEAGGPYVPENVQLVCHAINSFRSDQTIDELVWWCRRVVATADGRVTSK